jgi:hypothetical protein
MTNNQGQKQKRVIWVTGGKGGTGKSTFARGLFDTLLAAGVDVSAVDGDPENSQLFRYYQNMGRGVVRTELAERDGGDAILNEMDERKTEVILADVAAGGSQILMRLEDETAFLSGAAEMGYQFTIVSVLSPIKDSVNMLREAMATTEGHNVQHIAVKNLHFGGVNDFELLDSSLAKQRLAELGGVVLTMRDLFSKTYALIDKENLPFRVALQKGKGLPHADRSRVQQWLTDFHDQMLLAEGTLGL